MAGKGSKPRPIGNYREYLSEHDRIFRKKAPRKRQDDRGATLVVKPRQDSR
jgi:hypothetical protein